MRIQTTFDPDFEELYNYYNVTEKGKALLDIEGISRNALDIGVMSQKYFTNKVSDISLDANSNSNDEISHNNYSAEIVKGLAKLNSYYLLHEYSRKRFGLERANELLKAIFNSSVYFHDAASTQIPYCMAYSTSFIMNEGRKYGQLHSMPPKRAHSFVAQVIETTMDLSQSFAGAIAISDLIVNLCYYTKKENLSDYQIINLLQGFVHVMSNKFRVGGQSPFTNVSIFDRPNLEKLFEHYTYPDGTSVDYDYVIRIQKLFAEWFAEGDPVSGMP
ncbi:MAG TPA: anaerobic ribonucleoside-triphosphate reductase, partial [Paludibacteraceae bacterium]|nr:anaerobic ribonucleoside-triphosphate reductase [Paludibacteraceae bacterium]